ncbi:MAG: hypothetical protein WBG90_08570 [Saonia sp.]
MKELSFRSGVLDAVLSVVVIGLDAILVLIALGGLLAIVGVL